MLCFSPCKLSFYREPFIYPREDGENHILFRIKFRPCYFSISYASFGKKKYFCPVLREESEKKHLTLQCKTCLLAQHLSICNMPFLFLFPYSFHFNVNLKVGVCVVRKNLCFGTVGRTPGQLGTCEHSRSRRIALQPEAGWQHVPTRGFPAP